MGKDLCKSVWKFRFCDIYQTWIKIEWNEKNEKVKIKV